MSVDVRHGARSPERESATCLSSQGRGRGTTSRAWADALRGSYAAGDGAVYASPVSCQEPDFDAVRRWIATLPTAEECARAEYDRLKDLSIAERLAVFDSLHRDAVTLLAGRAPLGDPTDDEWWRRWQDPNHGR